MMLADLYQSIADRLDEALAREEGVSTDPAVVVDVDGLRITLERLEWEIGPDGMPSLVLIGRKEG